MLFSGIEQFVRALRPQLFEDDPSLEKNYSNMRAITQNQSAAVLYEQMYAAKHPSGPAINGAVAGIVRDTGITRAQSGFTNIVALASDPALKDISGYFFSKPQDLEKRQKLAYDKTHVESLRRLLERYEGVRNTLLSV